MTVLRHLPMPLDVPSRIDAYRSSLRVLESQSKLREEQALAILCARDALFHQLGESASVPVTYLKQVKALDARLETHQQRLCQAIDLPTYRSIYSNTAQRWWWHLDASVNEQPTVHPWDRNGWAFKLLTLGFLTVVFALLLNIANRFFSVGLGVSSTLAVAVPALVAFLKARSDLTKAGSASFDRFLTWAGIAKHRQVEAKFGLTIALFVGVVWLWFSLPIIADKYYGKGLDLYNDQQTRRAEKHFRQAIALDADHAKAHYQLGLVYEDWQRLDEAKEVYQLAASQGLVEAHNNLARLLILSEDYQEAVLLLQDGLLLRDKQSVSSEDQFYLYKNLGWARLSQGYLPEAKYALDEAINVDKTKQGQRGSAAAQCLLAQVLEKQEKADESIQYWQACCENGVDRLQRRRRPLPEEDEWIHQARSNLQARGLNCPLPDTVL